MTTEKTFTPLQETRYQGLKLQIRKGLATLFEIGAALREIRDSKTYLIEYQNFEEFCEKEYSMARQRAYQLMEANEIREALPMKCQQLLTSESQARALAAVPEEDRKAVMQAVKESKEPVTAKAIEQAAEKIVSPPKAEPKKSEAKQEPVVECDCFGLEIPADILPDWNRAKETGNELRSMASKLKCAVENGIEKDIIFRELQNVDVANFKAAHFTLRQILPHTVCPTCRGRSTRKTCRFCKQRGFVSEHQYSLQPEDIRKMHEKGGKK